MGPPRLASIIVTSYNHGRFLGEAIESALTQSYRDVEVIVVDDGSTDGSRDVIAGYGGEVQALWKPNGGQASAFNAGFAGSRGEVILFLDSDDVLLPTAVERALEAFDRPDVAKVHWPLWTIDQRGARTGGLTPAHELAEGDLQHEFVERGLDQHDWPPTSGNAWARRFVERVLPMPADDFRTCPDIYLGMLARLYGLVRRIGEPQSLYRLHDENNLGKTSFDEKLRMIDRSYAALADRLQELGIPANLAGWCARSWFHRAARAREQLAAVVPAGQRAVVIDQEEIRAILATKRDTFPFLERDGSYWGAPADDAVAIDELERLREAGATFAAFAWPAFWWLEHYRGFARHLHAEYRCVDRNDELMVFDLGS
jgi:glycosyltransferase involved in cell wall biosynthesis